MRFIPSTKARVKTEQDLIRHGSSGFCARVGVSLLKHKREHTEISEVHVKILFLRFYFADYITCNKNLCVLIFNKGPSTPAIRLLGGQLCSTYIPFRCGVVLLTASSRCCRSGWSFGVCLRISRSSSGYLTSRLRGMSRKFHRSSLRLKGDSRQRCRKSCTRWSCFLWSSKAFAATWLLQ